MSKPPLGEADAALAAGYQPDPDCACDGKCRWCALWTCEHCCNSYAAEHGVRETAPASS